MTEKDSRPKVQDWEKGMLCRIFEKPESRGEKNFRLCLTAGLFAIFIIYAYLTR